MVKSFFKKLLKKFTPRAELRLLGCRAVITFPLTARRFLGDGLTPRNPENMGSHFLSCKNLLIFPSLTVGLNPDCL